MSFINYSAREINLKIVILGGIGEGGVHPLEKLYDDLPATGQSKLTSLKESGAEVLFFDCLPEEAEAVRDFRIRLHLFGGAGRSVEGPHLKLLLRGADGVIFLDPSGPDRALVEARLDDDGIPYVTAPAITDLQKTITDLVETLSQ